MYVSRAQARAMAEVMGFDRYAVTEIETAVSELAHNILRHGISGEVWLRRSGTVFEVACRDRGPGFRGTAGTPSKGLGIGLTGVRELMDSLTISDPEGGGALVTARRSLPQARPSRGAVVGLVRLRAGAATCAGVGNVRMVDLLRGAEILSPAGCLGVQWPGAREERLPLEVGTRLLLATDGVPSEEPATRAGGSLVELVEGLVARASGRDDALALAVECALD
ncbi:MAG: ATP-binding protein [Bacillota bacterium]